MNALIVVDLTFGDAGKGSLIDFLARARRPHTVIRFNGGAQAAHNVIAPDGRRHTFSQFASATFLPAVRTHFSRFALFDPVALLAEEAHLRSLGIADALGRFSVDRRALVVSPFQKAANRLREIARAHGRHGSCGMGIGETMADSLDSQSRDFVLRVQDLEQPRLLRDKLRALQAIKFRQFSRAILPDTPQVRRETALLADPAAPDEFAALFENVARRIRIVPDPQDILDAPGDLLFEGAQGVLLDEWYGFHPYTTWSTTTFENALTLLRDHGYRGQIRRIGALRAYLTRHGPGPFVSESPELARQVPELHNQTNEWQRHFRVGWLDLQMLRYALQIAGQVDELAVTCLDHLAALDRIPICTGYEGIGAPLFDGRAIRRAPVPDLLYQERLTHALESARPRLHQVAQRDYLDFLESQLALPVAITSRGPTAADKEFRRAGSRLGPRIRQAALT